MNKLNAFLAVALFAVILFGSTTFISAQDISDNTVQQRKTVQELKDLLKTRKKELLMMKKLSSDVIKGGLDIRPVLDQLTNIDRCVNELRSLVGAEDSNTFVEKNQECRQMDDMLIEGESDENPGPWRKILDPQIECADSKRGLNSKKQTRKEMKIKMNLMASKGANVSVLMTSGRQMDDLIKIQERKIGKCKNGLQFGVPLISREDVATLDSAFSKYWEKEVEICSHLMDAGQMTQC